MSKPFRITAVAAALTVSAGLVAIGGAAFAQAANPCAVKAANPCTGKPDVDPNLVLRPKGARLARGDHAQLVKEGEALFKDTKLSTNGLACENCHADLGAFMPTFAKPYPHFVTMTKEKGGVDTVYLDEMVQFCMVAPMQAKPLPWGSRQLAALTAYSAEVQKRFINQNAASVAKPANPCAPKR